MNNQNEIISLDYLLLRFFSKTNLRYKCSFIIDVTPNSHNGCRLPSSRRL